MRHPAVVLLAATLSVAVPAFAHAQKPLFLQDEIDVASRLSHLFVLALATATGHASALVSDEQPKIEQLEAALLVTVARFVDWPPSAFPSPSAPIVIGVVSDEAIAVALESTSNGRHVNGRSVSLRRLQWDSNVSGVHLLFVGRSEGRRLSALLERVNGKQILTVSTLPEFARSGGMLTLQSTNERISFSINSRATEGSGLHLSSFLLSHATRVSDEGPAETPR